MRSEEEIRERIKKLEEELEELEWEKDYLKDDRLNVDMTQLHIEEIKDEIEILKWVLGEDEEEEVGGE